MSENKTTKITKKPKTNDAIIPYVEVLYVKKGDYQKIFFDMLDIMKISYIFLENCTIDNNEYVFFKITNLSNEDGYLYNAISSLKLKYKVSYFSPML
jgi:hypothetical protein